MDATILGVPDLPPELQQLVDQATDRVRAIANHQDFPSSFVALAAVSTRVQAIATERLVQIGATGLRAQGRLFVHGEKQS
jgi:hypothetical protein